MQAREVDNLAVVDPDEVAWQQLPHGRRADEIEGAGLGGHDQPRANAADEHGPEAARIHRCIDRSPDSDHQRVRAIHLLECVADLPLHRGRRGASDQVNEHLVVDFRLEEGAVADESFPEFNRVGQVAVVGHRHRTGVIIDEIRLGVCQH